MIPRWLGPWLVAVALTPMTGCLSPPPRPSAPNLSTRAPLAGIPTEATANWPEQAWWTRYDDPTLNALEARALSGAPSLAVAKARFAEAERAVEVTRAASGDRLDGQAQLQRERLSEHGLIPPRFLGFTWYGQSDLAIQFRHDFDFWGRHRAELDAALDTARAAAAERDAAANLLAAAVADGYFAWQATQARLHLADERIAALDAVRERVAARVAQGIDPDDAWQRTNADLAAAREEAARLEWSARMQRAVIAALLGVAEAELPAFRVRPLPRATAALPADARLDLIAHRADVAASRWRVEAALRDVDLARAAFFPDLHLSALLGLSSIDLERLLSSGSRIAAVGPALDLPLFDGGRLRARFGVSQAALERAIAEYEQAVVDAARDAAMQALALRQVQARRQEQAAALAAAQALHEAAKARERQGITDARPTLVAAAELARQRDAEVQLDAAALSAEIALTRALGGGYRPATEASAIAPGGLPQ
jgi:multidrug efflux system outer membrane protein